MQRASTLHRKRIEAYHGHRQREGCKHSGSWALLHSPPCHRPPCALVVRLSLALERSPWGKHEVVRFQHCAQEQERKSSETFDAAFGVVRVRVRVRLDVSFRCQRVMDQDGLETQNLLRHGSPSSVSMLILHRPAQDAHSWQHLQKLDSRRSYSRKPKCFAAYA